MLSAHTAAMVSILLWLYKRVEKVSTPHFPIGGRGDLKAFTWEIPPHPLLTKGEEETPGGFLVLQRGFGMWCHAAHQPRVEGGQQE